MAVQQDQLTELLAGLAISGGGTIDPLTLGYVASTAAERQEIARVGTVIGSLANDGSQSVARRAAARYAALWA